MASASFASEHSLEERIHQMQKLDLNAGVREVLEEASQLCGQGRDMEASALAEKAEAMLSAASPRPEAEAADSQEPLAVRILTNVTNGLAKVLVSAIQDLERHMTGETKLLAAAFDQRFDKFQSTFDSLHPLNQRLDDLAQAGIAVQEKYEQLAATTTALQDEHARHREEIGALRLQVQGLSEAATRIDDVCHRIEGQEREISTVNSTISELTSRMAAAAERLERHTGAIRALHQGAQQRTSALDQVVEALSRIKPLQNDEDGALTSI